MGKAYGTQWPHIPPGEVIDLPAGTEWMTTRLYASIYYNPSLNVSYHIEGNESVGYDVISYPYALCSLCQARRERYLYGD